MTKSLLMNYPSITDIVSKNERFVLNNQGLDTIQQVAKYETFRNMANRLGLTIQELPKSHKFYEKIADELEADSTVRREKSDFTPIIEVIKLPKVDPKDKSFYISIVRNTPELFKVATHHKKAKDSFCLITFAGLHQPSKKISSDAMKIISKFLKRKAFKVCRVDIAIDTFNHRPINQEEKKGFKTALMPFSKNGVTLEKTSFYINKVNREGIEKVNFYDKYNKQLEKQKKGIITDELKGWKRLEVTLTFDITKRENKGFVDYIEGFNFLDALCDMNELARRTEIRSYNTDYLAYQLNSILDNRFLNNQESKEQFNSVDALERFKSSDFRRYLLAV